MIILLLIILLTCMLLFSISTSFLYVKERVSHQKHNTQFIVQGETNYKLFEKEVSRQPLKSKYPSFAVKKIRNLFKNIQSQTKKKQNITTSNLKGKGIVIFVGGYQYITCAWVQIKVLRLKGCILPIEVWYNNGEIPECIIEPFKQELEITFHDLSKIVPFNWSGSYVHKILCVYFTKFKEVLFLEADNNCLRDPSYLFETKQYKQHGTIFWPDFWSLDKNTPIFDTYNKKLKSEFSQKSGQLLIDKSRCQTALEACLKINLQYIDVLLPVPDCYGDNDIWMSAWLGTDTSFYMIPFPVSVIGRYEQNGKFQGNTMAQKDVLGNVLFLHKNQHKWGHVKNFPTWDTIMISEAKDSSRWVDSRRYELYGKSVKTFSFSQQFGNYEDLCWQVLQTLRSYSWYKRAFSRMIPSSKSLLLWREPMVIDMLNNKNII